MIHMLMLPAVSEGGLGYFVMSDSVLLFWLRDCMSVVRLTCGPELHIEKVNSLYQRYLGDKLYIWKKTPEHQSDLVLDCSLYFHLTLFFYFLLHKMYLTHSYLCIYKHMICRFCRTRYCSTYLHNISHSWTTSATILKCFYVYTNRII